MKHWGRKKKIKKIKKINHGNGRQREAGGDGGDTRGGWAEDGDEAGWRAGTPPSSSSTGSRVGSSWRGERGSGGRGKGRGAPHPPAVPAESRGASQEPRKHSPCCPGCAGRSAPAPPWSSVERGSRARVSQLWGPPAHGATSPSVGQPPRWARSGASTVAAPGTGCAQDGGRGPVLVLSSLSRDDSRAQSPPGYPVPWATSQAGHPLPPLCPGKLGVALPHGAPRCRRVPQGAAGCPTVSHPPQDTPYQHPTDLGTALLWD